MSEDKKNVIYLHGYGSSSLSGTSSYLRKKMTDVNVWAPDIPVDPAEALPFLKNYCKEHQAHLVIGTSMGGMYAMQLCDYPRICVNPAFRMSQQTDILQVGTFPYFQPTADGRTHFTITPQIVEHFRQMEEHLFDGITPENRRLCWGFFADGDTTVNCRDEFIEHFGEWHARVFHGTHRMNEEVVREVIIPFARILLRIGDKSASMLYRPGDRVLFLTNQPETHIARMFGSSSDAQREIEPSEHVGVIGSFYNIKLPDSTKEINLYNIRVEAPVPGFLSMNSEADILCTLKPEEAEFFKFQKERENN